MSNAASGRNTTLRAFVPFPTLQLHVRKPSGISNPQTLHVTLLLFCYVPSAHVGARVDGIADNREIKIPDASVQVHHGLFEEAQSRDGG